MQVISRLVPRIFFTTKVFLGAKTEKPVKIFLGCMFSYCSCTTSFVFSLCSFCFTSLVSFSGFYTGDNPK